MKIKSFLMGLLLLPIVVMGAVNTNLLTPSFNRTNGMFVSPTNPQFATLTIGALTITNFTSFSNNHAIVNGVFFTNLFAAKTYATAGDTVQVLPGIYRTNNLLKNMVNWFFYSGAEIQYTNSGSGIAWGIFDDRSAGSVTCNIAGAGKFHYSGGMWGWSNNVPTRTALLVSAGGVGTINATNYLTERGVLAVTNSASRIKFDGVEASMSRLGSVNDLGAVIYVTHCDRVDVTVPVITDPNFEVQYQYGMDEFDVVSAPSSAQGIYWERGDLVFNKCEVQRFGSYGIWFADGPVDAGVYEFHFTGPLIQSGIYLNQNDQINRSWWTVADIETEANTGGASVIGIYGRGKHYFTCQKFGTKDSRPTLTTSSAVGMEVWVNAQKLSGKLALVEVAAGSKVDLTVQQYEDTGGATFGVINHGGIVTLHDGAMVITNGIGIYHEGGTTILNGVAINTSITAGTNSPVFVVGAATTEASPSGVFLRNCWLTAPALAYPVNATNAQFVRTMGSAANTNSSANVTFTVGTMTVHGTVR